MGTCVGTVKRVQQADEACWKERGSAESPSETHPSALGRPAFSDKDGVLEDVFLW